VAARPLQGLEVRDACRLLHALRCTGGAFPAGPVDALSAEIERRLGGPAQQAQQAQLAHQQAPRSTKQRRGSGTTQAPAAAELASAAAEPAGLSEAAADPAATQQQQQEQEEQEAGPATATPAATPTAEHDEDAGAAGQPAVGASDRAAGTPAPSSAAAAAAASAAAAAAAAVLTERQCAQLLYDLSCLHRAAAQSPGAVQPRPRQPSRRRPPSPSGSGGSPGGALAAHLAAGPPARRGVLDALAACACELAPRMSPLSLSSAASALCALRMARPRLLDAMSARARALEGRLSLQVRPTPGVGFIWAGCWGRAGAADMGAM
jgi:hypothetical protein